MDFKKKMKMRLLIAVSYCILGTILIVAAAISKFENHFISSFGFALLFIGILRIVQNRKITKSEHNMQRREVIETDERNIKIWTSARATAMQAFLMMGLAAGIVAGYFNMTVSITILTCVVVHSLIGLLCKIYYSKRF